MVRDGLTQPTGEFGYPNECTELFHANILAFKDLCEYLCYNIIDMNRIFLPIPLTE